MNNEQANKVKHLALGVMKVLERLEWKCNKCKGSGTIGIPDKTIEAPAHKIELVNCSSCVNGKIHYSWTPKKFQLAFHDETMICIILKTPTTVVSNTFVRVWDDLGEWSYKIKELTPILEWEEIERVLEKAGYELHIQKWRGGVKCQIFKIGEFLTAPLAVILKEGITVQEAVMLAIIELGKEEK